jgi:uncharacterized protein (DUF1684 family)
MKNNTSKKILRLSKVALSFICVFILSSCDEEKQLTQEEKQYISDLIMERSDKDMSMKTEPHSPFNRDTTLDFTPLKYFDPNLDFVFHSKLFRKNPPDTVKIMGTRGETRTVTVEGNVELKYQGEVHKVNIYKGFSRAGDPYYSIWFTDKTTGKETYGVGRYLDFELVNDEDHIYTLDFNRAYNPYCSYSAMYTCPIPREEDHIEISMEVGEKNFH